MLLTPFVRWQLRIFTLAAIVGAAVLALYYVRVPTLLGWGQYDVTANFSAGGGLYQGAQVTYHGVPIGRVSSMRVAPQGVDAVLSLSKKVAVPRDATANVHSTSAIGEQYVELVPPPGTTAPPLTDGSTIPLDHTSTPVQIGTVLDNVDNLVTDIPADKLTNLLHEAATALRGSGDDLGRLVDNGGELLTAAQQNLAPTQHLLVDSAPLMGAVNDTGGSIQTFSRNLRSVTAELKAQDGTLRSLVVQGGPAATDLAALLDTLSPGVHSLLTAAQPLTQMLAVYNPSLSALLSLYPRLVSVLQSVSVPWAGEHMLHISASNFNMPPACTQGYLPQSQQRQLDDVSHGDAPLLYCQAPSTSSPVRGDRNVPCASDPSRRTALASECPN